MRIGGGGLRRLTTNRFVSDVQPSWSPDGAADRLREQPLRASPTST